MATVIDGLYDDKAIADRFANVFQAAGVPNSLTRHEELKTKFFERFSQYTGKHFYNNIPVEVMQQCIENLKKGKAAGIDELTPEHVIFAHPILVVHLSLLFRMLLKYNLVPDEFGRGVVIPLVKNDDGNRFVTDNYRGITISPVMSNCLNWCYCLYLVIS